MPVVQPSPEMPSTAQPALGWMSAAYEPGLVSVIVPTYNRVHLIIDTLDSVFAQTYRPIDLMVVDDGSTDGTADVAERWAQRHVEDTLEVTVIRQENTGAPAARNRGLRESRGEYVQFLDSDDLLHPEKLRIQVEACRLRPDLGFVWSEYRQIQGDGTTEWPSQDVRRTVGANGAMSVPAQMWCGVFRRAVCEAIGPWEERLLRHQDWEYMTRMLSHGVRTAHVPGELYAVRVHGHGRIDDLNANIERALAARLEAERAAERVWREVEGRGDVGLRIGRHYFGTMLLASEVGDEQAYREAREKVRELGRGDRVLMGKEWLFDVCRRVGGHAIGRWGHDSVYAFMRLVRKGSR